MKNYSYDLPDALYRASQVRELDRIAIEEESIPGLTLMRRAGQAAFELARDSWPEAKHIAVICGLGNNAGDGYVFARLAKDAGLAVQVLQLGSTEKLKGDAKSSYEDMLAIGLEVTPYAKQDLEQYDLLVDGLFGTGLDRPVEGQWREVIHQINSSNTKVLALDIPSGLNADTGNIMGAAVSADRTMTFIGLKQGLFTGMAADHCGEVAFSDLEVPETIYQTLNEISSHLFKYDQLRYLFKPRNRTAHKGHFGHALVIGGDSGFIGATRMAAEAAARSGAGLVSVATREAHAALMNIGRPELMCHGVEEFAELNSLLDRATVVAIGPGLGQSEWATSLFSRVLESDKPQVMDADALNLLAKEPNYCEHRILTPHPGEAARLLNCSSQEVQNDRFSAAKSLQEQYGGVIVLKGSGTLVANMEGVLHLCPDGNPGMATGGMGDVLTGVITGLLCQGYNLETAAKLGVSVHARAADEAASHSGERGLLATDLIPFIQQLVN